ncbi:probable serine threonine- kinase gdt4 [Paramuricea clavata]|nr:probable serine threonine- kinase gdt4 [Paramuricea clavata]
MVALVACSSRQKDIVEDIDVQASGRGSRSLESLRRKRLRRNKKKREAIKMMSKSERKTKYSSRAKKEVESEILAKTEKRHSELKERCIKYQTRYEKEKEKKLKSYRVTKSIERKNLKDISHKGAILGKGVFGVCKKMLYRGITVAVKTFQDNVKLDLVKWEADVLNLFDHPGLPLVFGASLEVKPYQLVLQFHGIDGKCVTFNKAIQSGVGDRLDWVSIFKETAEALYFMHKKGFLHNDLKSDNIVLSEENNAIHPVIIDFGKCRSLSNPKRYSLTAKEQKKYKEYHRHIAPEVVKGTHSQSFKSDIYSYGYLLSQMSKLISKTFDDVIADISIACVRTDPDQRPTLTEIVIKLNYNV